MMRSLTKLLHNTILQNSKRMQTSQVPQQSHIIPIDPKIFQQALLLQLVRFKNAFEQLSSNNKDSIQINLSQLKKLQVTTKNGAFILQGNSDFSTLYFSSPLSGTYKYYYDVQQQRFYSNKDGHLLDQNLSRQAHKYFGDILPL